MSIVIPVTVKTLFTDTDFFESKEDYKIDYLQPYKPRPEIATPLPGTADIVDLQGTSVQKLKPRERSRSYVDRIQNLDKASDAALDAEIQLLKQNNADLENLSF
jgi:hypothetical protein